MDIHLIDAHEFFNLFISMIRMNNKVFTLSREKYLRVNRMILFVLLKSER